ncbi:MAG TPA: helix-turn-helix transcriptional regulator [Acidimicrobiales bacterium]|jgi:transcriptional regulator with XRE-family HTH domain
MSVFGDFVKLRREELNLDQAGLARLVGVNQQTVSKWEQAKAVPRPQRIQRLAEVLRVDISDLLRYAGYLPDLETVDAQSKEPLHLIMEEVAHLTNDQLIVLIDHAWEEYRGRQGLSLEGPRRRSKKPAR